MIPELSITLLAEKLNSGCIQSRTLVEHYLKEIENNEPSINSFVVINEKQALAAADDSDKRHRMGQTLSAIDGIPFAVKDNIDIDSLATGNGLGVAVNNCANQDAYVVSLLRNAGAIPLGKTNMHEGALGTTTNNPHTGATKNPYNKLLSPGGSSGGSAAAVAAGFCSFALGTDTMGSVRIPAAHCGLVGLRPSQNSISTIGLFPLSSRFDTIGILSHRAADLHQLFSLLIQTEEEVVLPSNLHLGLLSALPNYQPNKEIRQAFSNASRQLAKQFFRISHVKLNDYDAKKTGLATLSLMEFEAASNLKNFRNISKQAFSDSFIKLLNYGASLSTEVRAQCAQTITDSSSQIMKLFESTDIIATPTTLDFARPISNPSQMNSSIFTELASICGYPAISVPMGLTKSGLPMGLQLIGRPKTEQQLIAIADVFQANENL